MRGSAPLLLVLASASAAGGCATAFSTGYYSNYGTPPPYSGVTCDAFVAFEGSKALTTAAPYGKEASATDRAKMLAGAALAVMDFPLSFVADTVLLPITLSGAAQRALCGAPTPPGPFSDPEGGVHSHPSDQPMPTDGQAVEPSARE